MSNFNLFDLDLNGDGVPDAQGTVTFVDTDGDGVADSQLIQTDVNGDGIADFSSVAFDSDGDGYAETNQMDTDGDGILDTTSQNLNMDSVFDTIQVISDADNDGIFELTETFTILILTEIWTSDKLTNKSMMKAEISEAMLLKSTMKIMVLLIHYQ